MPVISFKQLGFMILSAIAIVLLLSRIPNIEQELQLRRQSVAVFQSDHVRGLTDGNMVDRLANLALKDRLVKVGWDHAILTIDMRGENPAEVWSDIRELIIFSYAEVNNVKHVLIRVFSQAPNSRLLLAAETRKTDWSDTELTELERVPLTIGDALNDHLRFSVTPSGKRWIANFANS